MQQNKHFFASFSGRLVSGLTILVVCAQPSFGGPMLLKTERFDSDPGWDELNNRANDPSPHQIVQNFGFASTNNAGGSPGEIGGFITPELHCPPLGMRRGGARVENPV